VADRLFLDANVLFSAAYREEAGLQRLWTLPDVHLLTSTYALEEARRNLSEPHQQDRLRELMRTVRVTGEASMTMLSEPSARFDLPAEATLSEKDWPILLAAVASGATHLITGDLRHFGALYGMRIQGVRIVRPATYLRTRSG
jgi:predicted nucleic acid-binding protein